MANHRHVHLLMIAGSIGTGAAAQPIDSSIDQISSALPTADMPLNPPEIPRFIASQGQITSSAESSAKSIQVAHERSGTPPPDQLTKPGKTAQPPQPLSVPAQGRPSAVEHLTGADRCDPADAKRPRSRCSRVIENRSAEFARPDPNALSPEQRLLLEQEVRQGALNAESGARRLAVTGEADESIAAMGVAASVLRPKDEVPERTKAQEDAAKAAEIVGAIINQPLTAPLPQ